MSLTPGTRLGPYEVVAKIGARGMGEVYRAKDTNLNRDAALKIILYGGTLTYGVAWQYDMAPDGRFLINVTAGDAVTAPITVIQNWTPKK